MHTLTYINARGERTEDTKRIYIGQANAYFTLTDVNNGYAETRRHLAGYSDADLVREYHEANKAGFNSLFDHYAREFGNLVVDEMHARGITAIADIFGSMPVHAFRK